MAVMRQFDKDIFYEFLTKWQIVKPDGSLLGAMDDRGLKDFNISSLGQSAEHIGIGMLIC